MLKVALTVLAVALAGTASAAGWRSMRIDARSEADFTASVSALRDKLPQVRRHVLDLALNDLGSGAGGRQPARLSGERVFSGAQGLRYKDVVTFTDASGETADRWYAQVHAHLNLHPYRARTAAPYSQSPRLRPGP